MIDCLIRLFNNADYLMPGHNKSSTHYIQHSDEFDVWLHGFTVRPYTLWWQYSYTLQDTGKSREHPKTQTVIERGNAMVGRANGTQFAANGWSCCTYPRHEGGVMRCGYWRLKVTFLTILSMPHHTKLEHAYFNTKTYTLSITWHVAWLQNEGGKRQ